MKIRDIILIIATLGIGYIIYKAYAKPSKPSKPSYETHCNPDFETVFICGNETYCCKTLSYIEDQIKNTEPPLRIIYLVCQCSESGCEVEGGSEDFDTQTEAIQWARANARKLCFQTVYSIKGAKPPRFAPPRRRPPIYPI